MGREDGKGPREGLKSCGGEERGWVMQLFFSFSYIYLYVCVNVDAIVEAVKSLLTREVCGLTQNTRI